MRSFLRQMSARAPRIALRPIRSAATALLLVAALPGLGSGFDLGFAAQAAPTPAGTVIRNIAEGSYFNTALGIRESVRSNPVEAIVAEVPDMEVTGFTDLVLSRGAMDQYHYEIRNTGNITLEMTPSMRLQGDTGLIGSAELIHDENRNGVIDPQEPVIDAETETESAPQSVAPQSFAPQSFASQSVAPQSFASQPFAAQDASPGLSSFNTAPATPTASAAPAAGPTSFTMEPGDRLSFIYSFRVSNSAQPGDRFSAILVGNASAISVSSETALSGEGTGHTTIVVSGLEIEKNQRLQMDEETGSDTLIYGLLLRNNSEGAVAGYDSVEGAPLRIDGQPVTGVLLRDEIPRNAVFAQILQTGGMTGLYHLRDAPAQDYQTTPPADPAQVDAVGFFHEGDYPVGRSTDLSFSVGVEPSLGAVTIDNTAQAYLDVEGDQVGLNSNRVSYELDARQPATLTFIDPETGADAPYGALNADTRVQIVSGACNVSLDVDIVTVTLRSTVTGDIETVPARETGPNTGLFRTAPVPLARMTVPVNDDGVMASDQGDRIQSLARCGNTLLEDMLLVEPGNFLFNSVSNAPVEGVTLALVDMASGQEMARSVTDARGFYAFGRVEAGDYRITTLDAPDWVFPSVRLDFPGYGRQIMPAAFGGSFAHEGGMLAITDVPVDPHYGAPIALRKSAERDSIGQGEFLLYTLEIDNNMQQALMGAQIFDRPPFGTELVAGSVTLDGAVLADPVRDGEGDMIFELGNLLPLERYELSYLLHFTAAAREGRNENTALLAGRQAGTGVLQQSPLARTSVRLDNSGGVFARQGTVIGSVFLDCNGNGIRDGIMPRDTYEPDAPAPAHADHEPGIPGVRIVTQEGLFVVTDSHGQYSLPGLRPVTHAFLVQPETLPRGTEVQITRSNDLRRGGSRVVPLRRGEMRAEHFAVQACTPAALAEIDTRRARLREGAAPMTMTASDLPIEGSSAPTRSARSEAGLPTTTQLTPGMLTDAANTAEATQTPDPAAPGGAAPRADRPARAPTPLAQKPAAQRQSLDRLVRGLDNTPGFLDLADGDTVARRSQNIRIKGKADLTLALLLNGRRIGADRVGEHTAWERNNVQAMEFVAVRLAPGENRLTLLGNDGFGIERLRQEIRITAPGDPARLEIIAPDTAAAAPASVLPVVVRILDARGLPVPASGTVTLRAGKALWDVTDIRPGTPGIQAYIDNGEATFGLIPPQVSGPDTLTVTSGFGQAETRITFTPDLAERVMIGVIEGAVALGDRRNRDITGAGLLP
ncbi:MAG: carboxypeptidase-like regulatory domain-containing protein, partial [Marinobacter sp.]